VGSPLAANQALEADRIFTRRDFTKLTALGVAFLLPASESREALAEEKVFNQFPLQPGFRETSSGLQFLDVRLGEGAPSKVGGKVVCDWAGYTIHLGRIIEAKRLTKGGAFSGDDNDLLRWTLGDGSVIPAFEEALRGMRAGGIRRIIVPPGPLSYPYMKDGTQSSKAIGPHPSSFSGQRALDFVLKNNGNIDKSLLFDIELLELSAVGAARRGPGRVVAGVGSAGARPNGLYDK